MLFAEFFDGFLQRKDRLILLDRDGVINEDSDNFIKSPDEFCMLEGSAEAIGKLNYYSFLVAIVTNQSGVGRGLFLPEMLDSIHKKMAEQLSSKGAYIDALAFCPHAPDEGCSCRKPKGGLIDKVCVQLKIPTSGHILIGDNISDMVAAMSRECYPILVRTGKGELYEDDYKLLMHDKKYEKLVFNSLSEVVKFLLTLVKI